MEDAVNWTAVKKEAALCFRATREHVTQLELSQQFLATGDMIVRERLVVAAEAEAANEMPVVNRLKLLPHHLLSLCQFVDKQHSEGRTGRNSKAQNFIPVTFEIEIRQQSA